MQMLNPILPQPSVYQPGWLLDHLREFVRAEILFWLVAIIAFFFCIHLE
jgi:hypothetical protein